MELEKFARQLRLMLLLTQNSTLSVDDISERIGMSRRTIYRYIDAFQSMGFIVNKQGTRYSLDAGSPFFTKLMSGISFTEDEAVTMSQVLNAVYDNSIQVRRLREKLAKLYHTNVLVGHGVDNRLANNINLLYQAIREERVVILRNYNSPSSGRTSNRIVEPYLFFNVNAEVRCYEISSGMNKTFKVSRCEQIELVDLLWTNKDKHQPFYNDLFGFTGETRYPVSIILDRLATSILMEEYPDAQRQLYSLPDGRHRLDTTVCSYTGIGRFVMGLYENIEIVDSPAFADFMQKRLQIMTGGYLE